MKDKGYISLILLYAIYFVGVGATGYNAVYFAGKGMNNAQIGMILSIAPTLSLLLLPVWGMAGDRAKYKKYVLSIAFFLSAAACIAVDRSSGFISLLVSMTAFNCSAQAIVPLAQSICIEYSKDKKYGFGLIRMAGSVAYQLMVLVCGFVLSDTMPQLYRIIAVVYLICTGYVLLTPNIKGHQHENKKINPLAVLKDQRVLLILIMTFCGKTASMYSMSFLYKHIQELFQDNVKMSILAYSAIILEIPFLFLANKLRKKLSITGWIFLGFAVNAFRFVCIAYTKSFIVMLLLMLPQFTIVSGFEFYPALYCDSIVSKELRSSMQSISTLVAYGLSTLSGSLAGGFLADVIGINYGFLAYGLFLVVCIAAFWIPARKMNLQWED